MIDPTLTRRQQEIYEYLLTHSQRFSRPPTLDELCAALGLSSRGSLHKHIQALIDAGLVAPLEGKRRGIRLTKASEPDRQPGLPFFGYIAAGRPIEAIETPEILEVPPWLNTGKTCYILQVKGDSMIEDGIFDGDRVVIEQRSRAENDEIVVALIDGTEATLKRIEQKPGKVILYPANSMMKAQIYEPDQVQIQGVLVGLMRSYRI